jgi:hypothetical protein
MSANPNPVFSPAGDKPYGPDSKKKLTLLESLRSVKAEELLNKIMTTIVLILGGVVILLPIAFMLGTSLKDKTQLKMFPPPILPYAYTLVEIKGETWPLYEVTVDGVKQQMALVKKAPGGLGFFVSPQQPDTQVKLKINDQRQLKHLDFHWSNYPEALSSQPFGTYFINTVLVVFISMLGMVISSTMVAYGAVHGAAFHHHAAQPGADDPAVRLFPKNRLDRFAAAVDRAGILRQRLRCLFAAPVFHDHPVGNGRRGQDGRGQPPAIVPVCDPAAVDPGLVFGVHPAFHLGLELFLPGRNRSRPR